jgi:hypothetical protein
MTRRTENIARDYLLREFVHPVYEFGPKGVTDQGFDLWLVDKNGGPKQKVELKAHSGVYKRPSNLFERLIFNAEVERRLFESGETVLARVFTGSKPFRVFIITNAILKAGASLQPEARYVLRGRVNYAESFTQLA